MHKFLLISPYRGMIDLLNDLSLTLPYEVHAVVGDLQNGLNIAKNAEQQGYDVIISRGGTAKLIRDHVNIPVVEIMVNGYDILRTLTFVKEYRGTIGIIGFPNIVNGADTIAELLGIQVMKFVIHHEDEAEEALIRAEECGVNLTIGDAVTVAVADRLGRRAILIATGHEALSESLDRAKETSLFNSQINDNIAHMKSILNAQQQGIVSVDTDGIVVFCNERAAELLDMEAEQMVGMQAEDIIGTDRLHRVAPDRMFTWVTRSISTGGFLYELYCSEDIQKLDSEFRRMRENKISPARSQFKHFIQTNYMNEEYMDKAKRWSRRWEPILIIGESGTGKRTLAEAIHNESQYQTGAFVLFDPQLVNRAEHHALLPELMRRAQSGTLFIRCIDELALSVQRQLAAFIKATEMEIADGVPPSFRLIASTSVELIDKTDYTFDTMLLSLLQIYSLRIPPLRTMVHDLDHIAFWHLAEMNRTLGKQVLGIKQDLMRILKSYHWPGNFREFKRVLKLLIEACDSSFINMEQSGPILEQLYRKKDSRSSLKICHLIAEGRTLDDMENELIQMVLEDEGYNQSTTAKRLGINRTTLWRRLMNKNM